MENIFYQLIVLVLGILFLGHLIVWLVRRQKYWYIVVPVIAVVLHHVIFYLIVFLAHLNGVGMSEYLGLDFIISTPWSSILRLHTLITLFSGVLVAGNCIRRLPDGNHR